MKFTSIFTIMSMFIMLFNCTKEVEQSPSLTISPVEKILDRYISEIGGMDRINGLKSRYIEGIWTDDRPYRGEPIETAFKVYADEQGYWRYDSAIESYGLDQQGGWRKDSTGVNSDNWNIRSKLGYVFCPQSPVQIDRFFHELNYGRAMTLEYRKVEGVYTDRDSTYYTLWFDVETGLLNHIGYHWNLRDYKAVDGILIPHLIEQGRKGGSINLKFTRIEHNMDIPDSLIFRPGE